MDSASCTDVMNLDIKTVQENVLLNIIKELCSESKLSSELNEKVNRIIAECDLAHHSNLHKMSTADESTATLLGFMHQTSDELSFEEQVEFNEAIIQKIQEKIPALTSELDLLSNIAVNDSKTSQDETEEMGKSLNKKLDIIREQENEKMELMMEWLNHRLQEVTSFNDTSTELLTLKLKVMGLKTTILNLQVYQSVYVETNQSIKAFTEAHKDLKDCIKETEQRIKSYKEIIESDYN